jgi:ATP-binding protein involved in chromosome partitioning
VKVPILGIVENMSYLVCPHCSERIDVFSTGGGERTAREMKVNFLGALPLDPVVRAGGDSGKPVALDGTSAQGSVFRDLAQRTIDRINEIGPPSGPKIEISE